MSWRNSTCACPLDSPATGPPDSTAARGSQAATLCQFLFVPWSGDSFGKPRYSLVVGGRPVRQPSQWTGALTKAARSVGGVAIPDGVQRQEKKRA